MARNVGPSPRSRPRTAIVSAAIDATAANAHSSNVIRARRRRSGPGAAGGPTVPSVSCIVVTHLQPTALDDKYEPLDKEPAALLLVGDALSHAVIQGVRAFGERRRYLRLIVVKLG